MTRTGAGTATLARPSAPVGRLAELVAHLAGCSGELAVEAVVRALPGGAVEVAADQRLSVVARALLDVRHGAHLRRSA